MFAPDELAARVPRIIGGTEVLPNTFGLPVAVEGIKLRENIRINLLEIRFLLKQIKKPN
jgi:hypothetical protein